MKIRVFIFLFFLTALGPIAYAQDADSLNINFGMAMAEGGSKIDKTSITYRAPVIFSETRFINEGLNFRSRFQAGQEKFGGQSADITAEGVLFKAGPVRIGPTVRYFYAQDNDIIFKQDKLLVLGKTRKQYLMTGISAGIGRLLQNNFRINFSVGATEMKQELVIYADNELIEGGPVLFKKDHLPVTAFGGRASFPGILFGVSINISADNIRTFKDKGAEKPVLKPNINKIIPENQTIVEVEIKRPVWRNISLGINGVFSNSDAGMVFLGNSVGVKTSLSW